MNIQESLATPVLKNNKLVHVPSMAAFLVEGTKGDKYVITLFPKPKCSCPATSNCFHILACQMSVGIEIKKDKPKILNLQRLRKNSRKRSDKKSGRKNLLSTTMKLFLRLILSSPHLLHIMNPHHLHQRKFR